MFLSETIELFLSFRRSEGLSSRTLSWYRDTLTQFSAWLGPRQTSDVATVDIVAWLNVERARGLAPSSVDGRYRALSALFNWCEGAEEVGCPVSPIGHGRRKRVKRPKVGKPTVEYVTYNEYRRVTAAIDLATWLDYRDWSLLGILYWTGLRRGEALALHVDDIDFEHHTVRVRHGKGDKARLVPVTEDVIAGIATYLHWRPDWFGPELWVAYDKARRNLGGPLTAAGLRMMLQRRCKRAGVRFLHPHAWRHGFGMAQLNGGADMSSVSTMMGHSSVRVTESIYARWLLNGLRREYNEAVKRIQDQR